MGSALEVLRNIGGGGGGAIAAQSTGPVSGQRLDEEDRRRRRAAFAVLTRSPCVPVCSALVVIRHSDIAMPFAKVDAEPVYLTQMKALLGRHPNASIIWAHTGLGRVVHPAQVSAAAAERSPRHVDILEAMLADPALAHVNFDISWDEVAKYAIATPEATARVAALLNKYPDRFLFGTDTVAPGGPIPYFAVFDMWTPVFRLLTPAASLKIRKGNYQRLFDEGRLKGRAWENKHAS
jgi:hypothetical protein